MPCMKPPNATRKAANSFILPNFSMPVTAAMSMTTRTFVAMIMVLVDTLSMSKASFLAPSDKPCITPMATRNMQSRLGAESCFAAWSTTTGSGSGIGPEASLLGLKQPVCVVREPVDAGEKQMSSTTILALLRASALRTHWFRMMLNMSIKAAVKKLAKSVSVNGNGNRTTSMLLEAPGPLNAAFMSTVTPTAQPHQATTRATVIQMREASVEQSSSLMARGCQSAS
mmetsp:Transcript_43893/g.125595  ORF Transcript_43893/g.125595 Transcript_43893/m.125595 type:complete len:227 (+) Transcript_43893:839-1519(+)